MSKRLPFDWFGFWVRFAVGALFGAFGAFFLLVREDGGPPNAWAIAGVASFVGATSGYWGDAFWETVANWFRW